MALGYAEKFDRVIPAKRMQRDDGKTFDPRCRLKFFDFVYPTTLKMAVILRSGGGPDKKMMELLDWIYMFWHFSAPAILLATQALSHKPPGKVFKGIGSQDRRKALAGVKNAAWDLVYISAWYEKMKQQSEVNDLTVLCSRDKVLLTVANLLRESVLGDSEPGFFTVNFGSSVLKRYNSYISDLSNTKRALMPLPTDFQGYRAKLVRDLEADILR